MQFYGMVGAEGRIYASVDQPQLVQIMGCRLVGAKPFSEPIMEHCSLDLQISVKFYHALENVVCQMAYTLFRSQYVNLLRNSDICTSGWHGAYFG